MAGSLDSVDALETMLAELRPLVGEWYPETNGTAKLEVVDFDSRVAADVIKVKVLRPDAPPSTIIVKAGTTPQASTPDDRPRLMPLTDAPDRRQLEFAALRMVQSRLAEVGDPRFVAVEPLGILSRSPALVMEMFEGEPLHKFLIPSPFRSRAILKPLAASRAAGRWLRILHDTQPTTQAVRQGTRQEIVDAFTAFGSYLRPVEGVPNLDTVIEAGIAAAQRLPDRLQTVMTHGDFAPRNILVDGSGRLAVIDLLGRWQAPPYEDVAGFLVSLQTSRANAATRGLLFGRTIERLEPAFLAGYYGSEPVPRDAIRVYELLLLLDKWAARAIRNRMQGPVRRVRERLIDSHFEARSRLLARDLAARS